MRIWQVKKIAAQNILFTIKKLHVTISGFQFLYVWLPKHHRTQTPLNSVSLIEFGISRTNFVNVVYFNVAKGK